jgi:hypothetical protein
MVFQTHGSKNASGLRTLDMKSASSEPRSGHNNKEKVATPNFMNLLARSLDVMCAFRRRLWQNSLHIQRRPSQDHSPGKDGQFSTSAEDTAPGCLATNGSALDASKGGKVKPGGFRIRGLVTETLFLGKVAACVGQSSPGIGLA